MKKKLLFKNATQYSKKVYDEFTYFHNDKYFWSYELFTIFIIILLIFCIIETIRAKVIVISLLFTITLIIFTTYRILGPISFYKKEVKKKAIAKEKTFNFYFYDNYFKIRDNLNFDKIAYFSLYKVYETPRYFYLYLTKKYSFIIDKQSFSQGTSEEFEAFMKKKMWFKYSEYNKKTKSKSAK